MIELAKIDVEILKYINEHEPAKFEDIKRHFKNVNSIEYRLCQLAEPEYRKGTHNMVPAPVENTSYISEMYDDKNDNSLGTYTITIMGKKALQDYMQESKAYKKELWLKNAWIPILVSVATNVVINVLKPLWPLIQQWVSSFL